MLDLAIIGGGPAGLTAGLYATRGGLKDVALFEYSLPGGQITKSSEIENYPGFFDPSKTGAEFMDEWQKQCFHFGLKHEMKKVERVEKINDIFHVVLEGGSTVEARSVIVASGSVPRRAGFEGEDKYFGRGVSICATCDGYFYKDKSVTVVGGGDTGLEEAFFLSNICSEVYVVHRAEEFTAAPPTVKRALEKENIHMITNSIVKEAFGDGEVLEGVIVENLKTGEQRTLNNSGCFVFVGYDVNNSVVKSDEGRFICHTNDWGEIIVDLDMKTNVEGLFAAGDVRCNSPKQVVSASGDGSVAGLQAISYVEKKFY